MLSKIDFSKLLKQYGPGLNNAVALSFMQEHWVAMVGGQAAKSIYPYSFMDGNLTLLSESSTALTFYRSRTAELIDEINSYIAGSFVVTGLLFRIGRLPARDIQINKVAALREHYYIDDDLVGLERIKVIIEYKKLQKKGIKQVR